MTGHGEKHSSLHSPSGGYALVIHGGAGTMSKKGSTLEQQAAYKTSLRDALEAVSPFAAHYCDGSVKISSRDTRSFVREGKL